MKHGRRHAETLRQTRDANTPSTASGADVNTLIVATQATVTRSVQSAYTELFVPLVGAKNAFDRRAASCSSRWRCER